MKKIYILDGSWYIFRAYYALPEIKDKEWNLANAIYGFFKMIFSLLKDNPDYLIITWDSPAQTLREKDFAEYKINRPSIPDDFKAQIKKIKDISTKIWLNTLEIPGYEADDIIFNLVKKLDNKNNLIYIISSDKDLKQLLKDNVVMLDPMKWKKITHIDFLKEYWFKPAYIVDFLSLTGDNIDNIPWVKWIGKKTAQQLIQQFNTIENIYQNLDKLPEKTKKLLEKDKENTFFSKKLIQLMDIPEFEIDLNKLNKNIDIQQAKKIFIDQLGFKSFEKILNQFKNQSNQTQQLSLF